MNKSSLYSSNQKMLNLTSVNIYGSNLSIDTSVNFRNNLFYLNSNDKIGILKNNPQYTLDVSGDINFTGNIYNNGSIITTETTSNSLWSNNSGNIFYTGGGVGIGTSSNPSPYLLYVNGSSYFVSQVNINDSLDVNSYITCDNIIVSDTTTSTNLEITGTTELNGLTSSSLITTNGLTILTGDLNITNGDIIAPGSTISCLNLYVTDQTSFSSSVVFDENVTVLGKLYCLNNFDVNNKFLVNSSSGNISTTGSATITNSVSIGSTLNVAGFSELYKAKINNDLTINGNLYVETGSTSLNNLTVNNLTILNGNVSIDSSNVLVNKITESVEINYPTLSTSIDSGALVVSGGVGIGGNLIVQYPIVSLSGQSEFIDLTVNNDFISNGPAELKSGAEIYGNTYIYGNLICDEPGGTINAVTGLDVGESSIGSGSGSALTIDSSGNLTTEGNVQIGQDLIVEGNIVAEGNLNLAGVANFSGGIITNSRFIQDTSSTYNIYTTYSGSNFVIVGHSTLNSIVFPSTDTPGANYKFIIGPGYVSGTGNVVSIQSSSISIFGLIDNMGTYTSVSSITTITLNSNAPGDFIEFNVVLTNSSGGYSYWFNAKSSQSDGFTFS
jgi:hypothetical protein